MNKFLREMEIRNARSAMIRSAMRDYEDSLRAEYGSPYAAMAGVLESLLTSLAADRMDSTEDVVRQLKSLTKRETV
jgi:meiotically up-regulated gene 157 (Mug157) protein